MSRHYFRGSSAGRMLVSLAIPMLLALAHRAEAICCPFPCVDCNLTSAGQLNFVSFDRAQGTVRMIPNLRIIGESADFALVVPTPALPSLEATQAGLWSQAERLTQPISVDGDREGGLSCSTSDVQVGAPAPTDDGVTVYETIQIGGMLATILSSTNADTLATWLNEHQYRVRPEDTARLAPYIERQWFFTAMRPDSSDTQHPMPSGGWNTNVSPIAFTWAGDRFELPLDILDINRAQRLPMLLYVLDEHRARLEGFTTEYANHLDPSEYAAIQERYPSLALHLREGMWFTRLTRIYNYGDTMAGSLSIERAPKDEEYRRVSQGGFRFLGDAWLLGLAAAGVLLAGWRERARAAAQRFTL